jgi:DNA-binding transcriptional MerR regulator
MTILYSILDHPHAIKALNDAGVPTSRIKSLLDDYPDAVRQSPANFAYVSSTHIRASAAKKIFAPQKTNAARSRRLKNIYGFITRKMNAGATGARDKFALDKATMAAMNRKMRLVEPDMSDTELQALLAALMRQEPQQLARHSRRPLGYFIKHLSELAPAATATKKTTLSRRTSRKTVVD